jgi:DNA-binding transcriptional regulator YhcF (GntR family)
MQVKTKDRPIYERVAYEIAIQIANGQYSEGAKIKGRSLASTQFNVSTETMRKALNVLQDHGVITIKEQSGAEVISKVNALAYSEAFKDEVALKNTFQSFHALLDESKAIQLRIKKELSRLQKKYDINHSSTPIRTFDYQLSERHPLVGQTHQSINLYQRTGATLYGIVGAVTLSSPGKDYVFQPFDILYFSGDDAVMQRTMDYLSSLT